MGIGQLRNPLDPNEYVLWEEHGFEEVYVGLFKVLRPKRICVGFMAKEFINDNKKIGIDVCFDGKNIFGIFNF